MFSCFHYVLSRFHVCVFVIFIFFSFYLFIFNLFFFRRLPAVVPPHPGRGAEHQELQEPALADAADLQLTEAAPPHGHPSAEQPHGALGSHALSHASRIPKVGRLEWFVFFLFVLVCLVYCCGCCC